MPYCMAVDEACAAAGLGCESLHVLARRVESGCRVSGESMSVRLRVSAQLDTILVGL